ncbi:MAG TPA: hypothetical protein DCO72_11570 [Ruminococcus sp.]|nr:hypothetical protein [Ruminococcus sp.]
MMKAEEMRKISNNYVSIKAEKQLEKFEKEIRLAAEDGKKSVIVYSSILQQVYVQLQNNGYAVEELPTGYNESAIKISW